MIDGGNEDNVVATFRADVDVATTEGIVDGADTAVTDSPDVTVTVVGEPANVEAVDVLECLPCETPEHEGLYQDVDSFCSGLCLPCRTCTLDEFLLSVCAGTSDAVCNDLPTDVATTIPAEVVPGNSQHLLPIADTEAGNGADVATRSFAFANLAPGATATIGVRGEPQDSASAEVTRPLAPAAEVTCAPVLDEVYAASPSLAVVFEARDAQGHHRVLAPTAVTAALTATIGGEELTGTASCTMPEDGVALCLATMQLGDAWFPAAGMATAQLSFSFTTPGGDGASDVACGAIALGPRPAPVTAVNSSIAAVVTPTAAVYEADAVEVAVYARHDRPVQSFGVELNCSSCTIRIDSTNTDIFAFSTAGAGSDTVVVAGISRTAAAELDRDLAQQTTVELFRVTLLVSEGAQNVALEGKIHTFMEVRLGSARGIVDTRFGAAALPVLGDNMGDAAELSGGVFEWVQPVSAVQPLRAHAYVAGGLGAVFDVATLTDEDLSLPVSLFAVWPRGPELLQPATGEDLPGCTLTSSSPQTVATAPSGCDSVTVLAAAATQETAAIEDVTLTVGVTGNADFGTAQFDLHRPARALTIRAAGDSISTDDTVVEVRRVREVFADTDCSEQSFTTTKLRVLADFPDALTVDVTHMVALSPDEGSAGLFAVDAATSSVTGMGSVDGDGTLACANHDCSSSLTVRVLGGADSLDAVVLGVDAYAVSAAAVEATVDASGDAPVVAVTATLTAVSSSDNGGDPLALFSDSTNAARLHTVALVMTQLTQRRQQVGPALGALSFATSDAGVVSSVAAGDEGDGEQGTAAAAAAAIVQTAEGGDGLAMLTATWAVQGQACAARSYDAVVAAAVTPRAAVSFAADVTAVDLVIPNDDVDVLALTGLPITVTVTTTVTFNDGSTETSTSDIFSSADNSCSTFFGMFGPLDSDDEPFECVYTTSKYDMDAQVTIRAYKLAVLTATAAVVGSDGSIAPVSLASDSGADASLVVPPIAIDGAWPIVQFSTEATFSAGQEGGAATLDVAVPLVPAADVGGGNAAVAGLGFTTADDSSAQLTPNGDAVDVFRRTRGLVFFSATFAGLTAGQLTVTFNTSTSNALPFAVVNMTVAEVEPNDDGVFALAGAAGTTFALDIVMTVNGVLQEPLQVRQQDGSLLSQVSLLFSTSNPSALEVSGNGIITIVDGITDAVSVTLTAGGEQFVVQCTASLEPADGAGGFGPTAPAAASESTVQVPLVVQGEGVRAADLSVSFNSNLLTPVTVSAGADASFATVQFNSRPGSADVLDVFAVLPGSGITGDALEIAVVTFSTGDLSGAEAGALRLVLGGSVVEEVVVASFNVIELDEASTTLQHTGGNNNRRRSAVGERSMAAAPALHAVRRASDGETSVASHQLESAETPAMIVSRIVRSQLRARRSGPRGTVDRQLAMHPTFDMNGDGVLDVVDVLLLIDVYTGRISEGDLAAGASADTNSDTLVTFEDVDFLLSVVAGRLVALKKVAVTPVEATDSDCLLSFNVTALLTDATLGSPAAATTRLYLDLLGLNSTQFDDTFSGDMSLVSKPGINTGFVRVPHQATNSTTETAMFFLQVPTAVDDGSALGASVLQIDESSSYNFHTIQQNPMGGTQQGPVLSNDMFDVEGTDVALLFPFGYTPIVAFTNTLSTASCLAQRLPQDLAAVAPPPDGSNVVTGYELDVSWTAPVSAPAAVTAYFVQYRDLDVPGSPTLEHAVDGATTSTTITDGILPYHHVEVQVQVEFGARRSVITDTVVVRSHQVRAQQTHALTAARKRPSTHNALFCHMYNRSSSLSPLLLLYTLSH